MHQTGSPGCTLTQEANPGIEQRDRTQDGADFFGEAQKRDSRSQARLKQPDFEIWFKDEFTPAYPEHRRVQGKTALATLREIKPDADARVAIMTRLETWKASDDWVKERGKFVPGMGTFFADGWYQREPQALSRNGNGTTNGNGPTTPSPCSKIPTSEELDQRDRERRAARAVRSA
jgi:hypothetical protein